MKPSKIQNLKKPEMQLTSDAFSAAALGKRLVLEEDVSGDGIWVDLEQFLCFVEFYV